MKNERVDGIGSVYGGEYDTISFDGIGKLKGAATAKKVTVDGLFKGKGKLTTDEMLIDGIARVFRDIKAKNVVIDGILKLRRASLYACKITCDGIIIGNREVSADEIIVDGICSVSKMYGDNIILKNNQDKGIGMQNLKVPVQLKPFLKLYLGRDISTTHSIVDVLECTNLEAEDIKAKVIRANNVKLKGNCVVDKLFCDGEIFIDDTCQVKEIISKNQPVMAKKERKYLKNSLKLILWIT